jgi:HPt (histidine-containing phosphotransfer) domain-containing protein
MTGRGGLSGDAAAELSEQVKVLGEKFLQRTAGQILVFQEQLARLAAGDCSVLTPITEVAHKIHGSGAVFGFATLSECAGRLEELSIRMTGESRSAEAATCLEWSEQLKRELAQLSEELHAAVMSAGRSK